MAFAREWKNRQLRSIGEHPRDLHNDSCPSARTFCLSAKFARAGRTAAVADRIASRMVTHVRAHSGRPPRPIHAPVRTLIPRNSAKQFGWRSGWLRPVPGPAWADLLDIKPSTLRSRRHKLRSWGERRTLARDRVNGALARRIVGSPPIPRSSHSPARGRLFACSNYERSRVRVYLSVSDAGNGSAPSVTMLPTQQGAMVGMPLPFRSGSVRRR